MGRDIHTQDYDVFAGLDVIEDCGDFYQSARIHPVVADAVQRGELAQPRAQAFSRTESCIRLRGWTDRVRIV